MAKINTIIKFLIITGIIIIIDEKIYLNSILIDVIISKVFHIQNIHNVNIRYTSMYVSIAIVLSSDLNIQKKIIYSIGLLLLYTTIFAFVTIYIFKYGDYMLYLWFMTMTIPILLWKYIYKK